MMQRHRVCGQLAMGVIVAEVGTVAPLSATAAGGPVNGAPKASEETMELGEAALTSMTTRYFTKDPVSDETLEQAFDYARHAPQGGNRQPVRFIVVRDDEKKRQLQEWYLEP